MTFNFDIPHAGRSATKIELEAGQTLFILGANGTGKSSLLHRFTSQSKGRSRKISASRQTWLHSSSLEFAPSERQSYEQQARSWDHHAESRWMEQNAQIRSGLTLYDLIDAENVDARRIATAVREGDVDGAKQLARQIAPIAKINELLQLSGLPVTIKVEGGDKLVASKAGSPNYGAAELSDGERNALLVAGDVLTAAPGTLLIIDEPERHLHRSIISPLLTALLQTRQDCAFIVATHDLMLAVDNPESRVVLVRSCTYQDSAAICWETDIVPATEDIDESIKFDIFGARRRILYVEGDQSSLDQPIYRLLFPSVSVRPKGASKDVEKAVLGIRSSSQLHWVEAWGIIDHDGRDADSIENLQGQGVFTLPLHSVEALYYHPDTIAGVAARQAAVTGGDALVNTRQAIDAAMIEVKGHFSRLAARSVEKSIRRMIFSQLPTLKDIGARNPIEMRIDTGEVVDAETATLERAAADGDWLTILQRCPIRETGARNAIAKAIGLQHYRHYEDAVLQMLREDPAALDRARGLFGDLSKELVGQT